MHVSDRCIYMYIILMKRYGEGFVPITSISIKV